MKLKKIVGIGFGLVVLGVVGIQVVPVDRSNPPVTMDVPAPDHIKKILVRSCYDCHSNETAWPWYSYVAPMSWFVADHVHEGREHFNFSEWDTYDADDRMHIIEECAEEAAEGEMPLESYLITHRDAALTDAQIEALKTWASLATIGGSAGAFTDGEDGGSHEHEHDEDGDD